MQRRIFQVVDKIHKSLVMMKNVLFSLGAFFCMSLAFSQGEEVGPIMGNPDLKGNVASIEKSNPGTFDSTFIYATDTLALPFFDEFSKNKFQNYSQDYSAPGVTSDKKYHILDDVTGLPIANTSFYTAQQTFRRIFDNATLTYVDEDLPATTFQVGDLGSYPVVYASTDLFPPYYIYDTLGLAGDVSDTVWIDSPEYSQDSATQFFLTINDPSKLWLDDYAYHNYRFAVEPRSLGVVTFDGLDQYGYPYAINTAITNYADVLTSKPINMSGLNAGDSVYFSFLYQTEGLGDVPEDSDSLVLEFYAKDLDQWNRVWSASGAPVSDFKAANINVASVDYFKKGFQFRFRNYGSLSGSLDHFHIDYVHLRALSGFQDTIFKDFAFSYPIGSLLKDYTSVPWDHLVASPTGRMTNSLPITVHNGSTLPENNLNGEVKVTYGGAAEGSFVMNAQTLSGGMINYGPRETFLSYHDLSGGYNYDITKTGNQQTFDLIATAGAQFPNLAQNDSTFGVQYFGNYYSYNDGTAEAAYGPTGAQARLAVRFDSYVADSVIGVQFHFVPSVTDVSDKLFLLTVWENNNGVPGTVLYEDNIFFPRSPVYGGSRNHFETYYFQDTSKIPVGTSFFVGWRQFDPERLNVGLDRNNDRSEKTFYSLDGGVNWIQSQIPGSVMVRPIFSTSLDAELNATEIEMSTLIAYPNPVVDVLTIQVNPTTIENISVYNTQGNVMYSGMETSVDMSAFTSGVYFIRVQSMGSPAQTLKVIKF
jgi:hypothetical protein